MSVNIDPQKKIFYNYYNIVSKNISNDTNIQCLFEGKSNNPNIVYVNGSLRKNYISNNLQIFSNEMVIEHTPITNGGKKLYVSFPLVTDDRIENNVIDYIMKTNYNDNIEIELNDIINPEDKCTFYETSEYDIFIFSKPILVKTDLTNLPKSNFNQSTDYSVIRASQSNRFKEGFQGIEGFTPTPPNAMTTPPSFTTASPSPSSFTTASPSPSNFDKTTSPTVTKSNVTIVPPGEIVEQWMECDNVEVDYADEIPSYNVPIQSKLTSEVSGMITLFLFIKNFVIFILVLLFLYFVVPAIYQFLAIRSLYDSIQDGKMTDDINCNNIMGLNIVLTLLFFIIIIWLTLRGYFLDNFASYAYYIYAFCIGLFYVLSVLFINIKINSTAGFYGFSSTDSGKKLCMDKNNMNFFKGFGYMYSSIMSIGHSLVGK